LHSLSPPHLSRHPSPFYTVFPASDNATKAAKAVNE
jgi:hypothetical protein